MSNGPDLSGAVGACHAARSDIQEMHAEQESAKMHHQQADKETQNAKKAEGFFNKLHHAMEAADEQNKGDAAKQRADQHLKDAHKHLGEYNAAMGRDPTKGTHATGRDGPDCKPVEKALDHKNFQDTIKGVTDIVTDVLKKI
jgi:hypothetical protein